MFSPLARGSANWDGGIHLEHQDDDIVSNDSQQSVKAHLLNSKLLDYIIQEDIAVIFPLPKLVGKCL